MNNLKLEQKIEKTQKELTDALTPIFTGNCDVIMGLITDLIQLKVCEYERNPWWRMLYV